ncbi:MAG TPA: STAS domain-containing protein [Terriglobales bacterium]|nr:STAS domain-containing protein [Terriglobales bacterium]
MQMKIGVRTLNDGIIVVDCAGRIIFGEETAALRDQVKGLIHEGSRIVLNLADVTYIDSGGLGTLVALYTTARNAGATIALARLTKRVGDLLQVTKLLTVFEVYDTEEKAVQALRKTVAA